VVPSKRVPEFVDQITRKYVEEKQKGERFQQFIARIGKKELKDLLDKLGDIPPYELDRSYYSDWRDPREFTLSDITTGECAGEVVSMVDFDLQAAERQYFEAQLHFDDGRFEQADVTAYKAMLQAAKGLVRTQFQDIGDNPDQIVAEFRSRFVDTGLFRDKYAGGKFAEYLFRRHDDHGSVFNRDRTRHRLEECQLFIEAAHACNQRTLVDVAPAARAPGKDQTAPTPA
ncbi:MAG: nitrite/sulfite reductase, partial [Gammaproteobacteria bacterium]